MIVEKNKNSYIKRALIFVIIALLLLCILLLGVFVLGKSHDRLAAIPAKKPVTAEQPPAAAESSGVSPEKKIKQASISRVKKAPEIVFSPESSASRNDSLNDSLAHAEQKDSLKVMTNPCMRDTIKPWVYPDPSGGLHHGAVTVRFASTKPAAIQWRFAGDSVWQHYRGDSIAVAKSCTLIFKARDSCGNAMEERRETYEIAAAQKQISCPADMEFITIGLNKFCIDRYEWPNIKGALPQSFISLYQAEDSCRSLGKRLCSSEEWSLACAGPAASRFPYGEGYERHACVTEDTVARPAGSRPECRGYFEVFDMSGNLMEWTSTRSALNHSFYNVMGGFFSSGPESECSGTRYSYFPQNRHNPVGFRCCKDTTSIK